MERPCILHISWKLLLFNTWYPCMKLLLLTTCNWWLFSSLGKWIYYNKYVSQISFHSTWVEAAQLIHHQHLTSADIMPVWFWVEFLLGIYCGVGFIIINGICSKGTQNLNSEGIPSQKKATLTVFIWRHNVDCLSNKGLEPISCSFDCGRRSLHSLQGKGLLQKSTSFLGLLAKNKCRSPLHIVPFEWLHSINKREVKKLLGHTQATLEFLIYRSYKQNITSFVYLYSRQSYQEFHGRTIVKRIFNAPSGCFSEFRMLAHIWKPNT